MENIVVRHLLPHKGSTIAIAKHSHTKQKVTVKAHIAHRNIIFMLQQVNVNTRLTQTIQLNAANQEYSTPFQILIYILESGLACFTTQINQ